MDIDQPQDPPWAWPAGVSKCSKPTSGRQTPQKQSAHTRAQDLKMQGRVSTSLCFAMFCVAMALMRQETIYVSAALYSSSEWNWGVTSTIDRCETIITSIEGYVNDYDQFLAGSTNNQAYIDQNNDVMNPTQPDKDCFAQHVPVVGHIKSGNLEWVRFFTHQMYSPGTYVDEFYSFKNAVVAKLSCYFCTKNTDADLNAYVVTVLEKNSPTVTNQGHVLLLLKYNTGQVMRSIPFNHKIETFFTQQIRNFPIAWGLKYNNAHVLPYSPSSTDNYQVIYPSGLSWDLRTYDFETRKETSTSLKTMDEGINSEWSTTAPETYITAVVYHDHQIFAGGSVMRNDETNPRQWPYFAVFDEDLTISFNQYFDPTVMWISYLNQGRIELLYGWQRQNLHPHRVFGTVTWVTIEGEMLTNDNFGFFFYDKNCNRKVQMISVLLFDNSRFFTFKKFVVLPLFMTQYLLNSEHVSIFMYQVYGNTLIPRAMSSVDYQGSKKKDEGLKRFISLNIKATGECSSTEMTNDYANGGTGGHLQNNYLEENDYSWGSDKHFYAFSSMKISRHILAVFKKSNYRQVSEFKIVSSDLSEDSLQLIRQASDFLDENSPLTYMISATPFTNQEVITFPNCTTASYTTSPIEKNLIRPAGDWFQWLEAKTLTQKNSIDLTQHVSFQCGSETDTVTDIVLCNACPLSVQWFWTTDGASFPTKYGNPISTGYLPRNTMIVSEQKFSSKFINVNVATTRQTISPGVRMNTLLKESSFQYAYADYRIMYSMDYVFRYPETVGFTITQCTPETGPTGVVEEACNGLYIPKQLYQFAGNGDQNQCYEFKGQVATCNCLPVDSWIHSNFRSIWCPVVLDHEEGAFPFAVDSTKIPAVIELDKSSSTTVDFTDFIVHETEGSYKDLTQYLGTEITNPDGSNVASDKLTFGYSYAFSTDSGKTSMTIDVQHKTGLDPFLKRTFAVNLYRTVARKYTKGLIQADKIQDLTRRFAETNFNIIISLTDCSSQTISKTLDEAFLVKVNFYSGKIVLLTDAQIKSFFTAPEKTPATLCTNIPYYDVLNQNGVVPDDITDYHGVVTYSFKTQYDMTSTGDLKVDTKLYIQPNNNPSKQTYKIQIKANHRSSVVGYPSATKIIKVEVTFIDCSTKTIENKFGKTFTAEYDVEPVPVDKTVDLSGDTYFKTTEADCPITSYVLKAEDNISGKDLTDKEKENFIIDASAGFKLKIKPKNSGTFNFWLFAKTDFAKSASQKFEVTMPPCSLGVGLVSLPTSFNISSVYYASYENDIVTFSLTKENLLAAEKTSMTSKIKLPKFVSNDPTLCPLTYSVSPVDVKEKEVIGLSVPTFVDDGIEFSFSLSALASQKFELFLTATNPKQLFLKSPKVVINVFQVCDSFTGKLQNDTKIDKKVNYVLYVHEIEGTVPEFQDAFPFIDAIRSFQFDKLATSDCALKLPYIVVSSTSQKSEPPVYTYQIDDNVIITVNSDSLQETKASMKVNGGGFKTTFNAEIPDISGQKIVMEVTLAVCGTVFWETDICTQEKPAVEPVVNAPPEVKTGYLIGLTLEDMYAIYDTGVIKEDSSVDVLTLTQTIDFGYVSDAEDETVSILAVVDEKFVSYIQPSVSGSNITLTVDMKEYYASKYAVAGADPPQAELTISLDDLTNQVEKSYTVYFPKVPEVEAAVDAAVDAAVEALVATEELVVEVKPVPVVVEAIVEETKQPEAKVEDKAKKDDEKDKATASTSTSTPKPFVPTFNFAAVPVRVAANEPVAIADAEVPAAKRVNPQISSVLIDDKGLCSLAFSKPMMYPMNWVAKHLRDAKRPTIDENMVDSISVPFLSFWYEQVDTDGKQIKLPDEDIKILEMTATTIVFNVSFSSLDDPEAISLTSSTEQDKLVLEIPKTLIMNDQTGTSLILDASQFDDEDDSSFYSATSLEPQEIIPKSQSTESIAAATKNSPAINAASTVGGLAVNYFSGAPPEDVADDLASEQQSAMGSGLKMIQPGTVNGFNKDMRKSAGCDYKQVDFLSRRNMTWTSQPCKGDGLQRWGIKSTNAPKNIGSALMGGAGAMICTNMAMPMLQMMTGGFEGGTPEPSLASQVTMVRRKFRLSQKAPLTPTINAFIGMIYIKLLTGGIVNQQNNHLLQWDNFGPSGDLSAGDQWSLVFGYACLFIALIIVIMLTLQLVMDVKWMFAFGKKVVGLENILRRRQNHKWFLFTMGQLRTFTTVYVIVYYSTPNFSVPQVMLGIFVNPANLFFAFQLTPFPTIHGLNLNWVAKGSDLCAIIVMYHQLMVSDINSPAPQGKILVGWVVLVLGQVKFYLGKLKLGGTQYVLHKLKVERVKNWCCRKKTVEKLTKDEKFFNLSRTQFIDSYRLAYKKKFFKLDKMPLGPESHYKVAPLEAFRRLKQKKDPEGNMYVKRHLKNTILPQIGAGKLSEKVITKRVIRQQNLKVIFEQDEESQSHASIDHEAQMIHELKIAVQIDVNEMKETKKS